MLDYLPIACHDLLLGWLIWLAEAMLILLSWIPIATTLALKANYLKSY